MRIGLISDTHGLLRPEALVALRGVNRILHAGDIGNAQILEALAEIAPVDAVRGNNDRGLWAKAIPPSLTVSFNGVAIHLLHDFNELNGLFPPVRVIVAGHSHKPMVREEGGVLLLNPGSAGPRRFRLPISVGVLTISNNAVSATITELQV